MQISESLRWPSKGHHRDQEVIEKVQQLCAEYGREEEGGFDKTNICQGRLSHNLPIQSKLNILQWMKFSMCKRGLCTHWLIWLFRKWVGIETMKLWVQWLWGEGSYQSLLLLFGRSLDVSCLIHGYYTQLPYILLWKLLSYRRLLYIRLMSYTDGYYTYYCWSCLHACGLHQDWTIVRPMPRSEIALTSKKILRGFRRRKNFLLVKRTFIWQGN